MEAAQTTARNSETAAQDNLRRCLVTGELLPKEELVRFVIGPDSSVVPDLSQDLPGRGLWIKAERGAIDTASQKGLFAKAAKAEAKPDPALADFTAKLLKKRCLDYLGLAKRSAIAVLGETQVKAELRAGKIALLIIAEDAKEELPVGSSFVSRLFNRSELGAALGYEQSVYVGLKSHKMTQKLQSELIRLEKIIDKAHIEQGKG